jgi:tetratricopeptide (TPR) repeat protein
MGTRRIKPKKSKAITNNVVPFAIPDRRAMERQLAAFGGPSDPDDPRAQAQEIIWDAWEYQNPKDRIDAAKEALLVYPDCVDAYNILAENSLSIDQAMEHYKKGVEAGERDLGQDFFEEHAGHFWGVMETRPYMRAMQGFAQCCVHIGDKAAAAKFYTKMIELNPHDNQGIRCEVVPLLIELEKFEEATAILDQYKDDAFASAAYNRALLMFREFGESAESQEALAAALKVNGHVPKLLCGKTKMPKRLPDYHGFGDVNEAATYVHEAASAWKKTAGALEWIDKIV